MTRGGTVDDLHERVVAALRGFLDGTELSARREAEIRNPLGRLLLQRGEFEAGAAELEWAVAQLGHLPLDAAKAMLALAHPFAGLRPAAYHRRWLQEALRLDPARLSPADRLHLAVDRATVLLFLGDEEGWAAAAALPVDPAAVGVREQRQLARAWMNIGLAALVWGRYPEARSYLSAGQATTH